jgi:hypothetical protein
LWIISIHLVDKYLLPLDGQGLDILVDIDTQWLKVFINLVRVWMLWVTNHLFQDKL